MENTTPTAENPLKTKTNELQLFAIKEVQQDGTSFIELAESINALFYSYIQECVYRNSEIGIDQVQIYNIKETVDFLRNLHTTTENKN
jgi:hypothetical protein